jgi:hypothetical protein
MKTCALVYSDLPMNTSQAPMPWKMTARRFGGQVQTTIAQPDWLAQIPGSVAALQQEHKLMPEHDQRTNRLLSLLSDNDYERLRPHLSPVVFDYRKMCISLLTASLRW